jgi:hypothetical protein
MHRTAIATSLAGLCFMLWSVPAATAASLTRIETAPVYGAATVTVEHGVQVYRPLPPLRHMILNPEGRTPLNLTIEDRNVVVQHHHYGVPSEGTSDGAGRFVGGYGWGLGLPRVHRGHHGHRHAHRSRPGGYMVRVPRGGRSK